VAAAQAQSPPAGSRRPDEDAVRAVVRQYVDAREARNPKAVAALFTADSDQLVSSGEWRVGRDDVVSGSLASSAQSAGKRTIDVERVRFVSSDVAIADGRYSITGLGGGGERRAEGGRLRGRPAAVCGVAPCSRLFFIRSRVWERGTIGGCGRRSLW